MFCKNCQKEISDDSKFCEFCRSKVIVDKGYSEMIKQMEKSPQTGAKRKKLFKNTILLLSVFITVAFFLEANYDLDGGGLLIAVPMTILIIFIYKKIEIKFNL